MKTDLEIIMPAVVAAGQRSLRYYREEVSTEFKTGGISDPVSAADLAAEKILLEVLIKEFPDDKIVSEEAGELGVLESNRSWLLDPIDGTFNFLNGIDHGWSVALSLVEDGQTLLAINYFPVLEEAIITESGELIKYTNLDFGKAKSEWMRPDVTEEDLPGDKELDQMKIAAFFDQTRSQKHSELVLKCFQEIGIICTPVSGSQTIYELLEGKHDGWIIPDVEEWDWRTVFAVFESLGGKTGLVNKCGVAALTSSNFDALSSLIG